ncbi:hypothetical protein ACTI_44090 [Actinoplanes sp. OR16]|uniref:hypothetical protein n=1 Tax=Actinoplanes sp. OR16 TaxID=946334 RepID=UPI000F6B70FA|nr:hypothetical protein [Actinoplanes sp. OR16]BBH67724.1 hypothetical protein ACTI_44090 [Actinoplanes sp. OR16]
MKRILSIAVAAAAVSMPAAPAAAAPGPDYCTENPSSEFCTPANIELCGAYPGGSYCPPETKPATKPATGPLTEPATAPATTQPGPVTKGYPDQIYDDWFTQWTKTGDLPKTTKKKPKRNRLDGWPSEMTLDPQDPRCAWPKAWRPYQICETDLADQPVMGPGAP